MTTYTENRTDPVYVEGELSGIPIAVAIECKKYGRPIDVGEIDAFRGKLHDLSVDKGVFYVHDAVTQGARNLADATRHPRILLKEFAGAMLLSTGWEGLIGFDCPNENCRSGSIGWGKHKQPAGGADVEAGYCDVCGTFAIRCRDCEEVDFPIGIDDHNCIACGATYKLERDDYQDTEIDGVVQLTRCED
jgi:hypothetical protein